MPEGIYNASLIIVRHDTDHHWARDTRPYPARGGCWRWDHDLHLLSKQSLRRAEWLYSLFEKFFCGTSYARIRRILDRESCEDIEGLRTALETHSDQELEEAMVDYLNFFEFVASLHQLRQLTTQELRMVCDYHIQRLGDHPFVMTYITEPKQGFEGLVRLVHEVRSQVGQS